MKFPFFRRKLPRLEEYFQPLSDIDFPEELLFLGSGSTPPESRWTGIPSVRINDKTLGLHPGNPVFAVITQIISTPRVLRHPLFRSEQTPWVWQFMNEIKLETSREWGLEKPLEKYRLVGTKELKDVPPFRSLGSRFTTGSLVILFLLFAPVRRVLIAGYDGYLGERSYLRADGKPWHGRHHGHDLGNEWRLIEGAARAARSGGKEVVIAKSGGSRLPHGALTAG